MATMILASILILAAAQDAPQRPLPAGPPRGPTRPHASWDDAFGLAQLSYPDLAGELVSLGDARFAGRVRILQIAGSSCPACHDQTAFLTELDRTYRDRGLSITALCFELTGLRDRDAEQARRMLERHGATYPALLAGRQQEAAAQQALPALGPAFDLPTTVFLHRDGRVRAVHAGFPGPDAGDEQARLRAQLTDIVEDLLAEPLPEASVHEARIVHELWRDERERTFTSIERGEDGRLRFTTMEMTRFDRPTRTEPVGEGVAVIDGATVRLGREILHYDARAHVMLDAGDVAHRYTPAARSPFPVVGGTGHSETAGILAGLSSTDAVLRRESAFYLALQLVQDRHTPPEMGGGQLDPGLAANVLPLVADGDTQVRATASWAAGVVGLDAAADKLMENLEHGFAPVRREAARALGALRHEPALQRLEKLAEHDIDPLVRASAAESVRRLRAK